MWEVLGTLSLVALGTYIVTGELIPYLVIHDSIKIARQRYPLLLMLDWRKQYSHSLATENEAMDMYYNYGECGPDRKMVIKLGGNPLAYLHTGW